MEVDSAGLHVAIPISEEARKFLAKDSSEQYLKKLPEDLDSKPLNDYDLIVAMDQRHKEIVLSKCPEFEGKITVWNIEDPYFLTHEHAEKIYKQIKEKVTELAKSLWTLFSIFSKENNEKTLGQIVLISGSLTERLKRTKRLERGRLSTWNTID